MEFSLVISTLCASPTCRLLVSLSLSLSRFSLQTRQVRSIGSLSCADSEGHRPTIIGGPVREALTPLSPYASTQRVIARHTRHLGSHKTMR
jgi:hypothetical protein